MILHENEGVVCECDLCTEYIRESHVQCMRVERSAVDRISVPIAVQVIINFRAQQIFIFVIFHPSLHGIST